MILYGGNIVITLKDVCYIIFILMVIAKIVSHLFGLGFINLFLVLLPLILYYGGFIVLFLAGVISVALGINLKTKK